MRALVQGVALAVALLSSSRAIAGGAGERAYYAGEYVRAAALLREDAYAGRATAQSILGYQYQYGLGVPQSYVEAARWYACAANQGQASAQFFLGLLYDRGQGVAEDPVEAEKWLDLAAAQAPADRREYWETMRDTIGGKMTLDELKEGRRRAVAWAPSYECRAVSKFEAGRLPTKKYGGGEADRER